MKLPLGFKIGWLLGFFLGWHAYAGMPAAATPASDEVKETDIVAFPTDLKESPSSETAAAVAPAPETTDQAAATPAEVKKETEEEEPPRKVGEPVWDDPSGKFNFFGITNRAVPIKAPPAEESEDDGQDEEPPPTDRSDGDESKNEIRRGSLELGILGNDEGRSNIFQMMGKNLHQVDLKSNARDVANNP